jgi:hypothetical protein
MTEQDNDPQSNVVQVSACAKAIRGRNGTMAADRDLNGKNKTRQTRLKTRQRRAGSKTKTRQRQDKTKTDRQDKEQDRGTRQNKGRHRDKTRWMGPGE